MQKIHVELTGFSPESADRLIEVLRSYLEKETAEILLDIQDLSGQRIALPTGAGSSLLVPYESILYVTSDRHWSVLQLTSGPQRFRINYSEVRSSLPEAEFLDCNRGILLNMRHIQSTDRERFLMDDGAAFPIRRKGRREICLRWEQYRLDHSSRSR